MSSIDRLRDSKQFLQSPAVDEEKIYLFRAEINTFVGYLVDALEQGSGESIWNRKTREDRVQIKNGPLVTVSFTGFAEPHVNTGVFVVIDESINAMDITKNRVIGMVTANFFSTQNAPYKTLNAEPKFDQNRISFADLVEVVSKFVLGSGETHD